MNFFSAFILVNFYQPHIYKGKDVRSNEIIIVHEQKRIEFIGGGEDQCFK